MEGRSELGVMGASSGALGRLEIFFEAAVAAMRKQVRLLRATVGTVVGLVEGIIF